MSMLQQSRLAFICVVVVCFVASIRNVTRGWGWRALQQEQPKQQLPTPTPATVETLNSKEIREQLVQSGLTPLYRGDDYSIDPWKAELFSRLDRIRLICGELCRLNTVEDIKERTVTIPETTLDMVVVPNINCNAIMESKDIDASDLTAPAIPDELLDYFTLGGAMNLNTSPKRRKEIYLGNESEKKLWSTGNVW